MEITNYDMEHAAVMPAVAPVGVVAHGVGLVVDTPTGAHGTFAPFVRNRMETAMKPWIARHERQSGLRPMTSRSARHLGRAST